MFLTKHCTRAKSNRVRYYDHLETDIPVLSTPVKQLSEGVCLRVFGFMPENCEKFAIHLSVDNAHKDIALRLNPRLPQNFVVRNARIASKWGQAETASGSPFVLSRGRFFRIHILTTSQHYLIALNGVHFAEFDHRIPLSAVASVKVYGDVSHVLVTPTEVTFYPERRFYRKFKNLAIMGLVVEPVNKECMRKFNRCSEPMVPLPFYGLVPQNYQWNRKHIRFEGRVKLLPLSFTIKLQNGQNVWPHPIVPFHFSHQFLRHRNNLHKGLVERRVWDKGAWISEETASLISDLCPGRLFSLVIAPVAEAFEVYINGKFVIDFRHVADYNLVDTVYVKGDIKLWQVVIEQHNSEAFVNPKREKIPSGLFF